VMLHGHLNRRAAREVEEPTASGARRNHCSRDCTSPLRSKVLDNTALTAAVQ
jgi:hypothetical protein